MTVEELEIIVTAKVEEALKEVAKMIPAIKETMKQAQEAFSQVNTKEMKKQVQQAVQFTKKKMQDLKKSTENNELAIKINNKDAEKQISQIQKQIDSLQEKITARRIRLDVITPKLDKIANEPYYKIAPEKLQDNKQYISLSDKEQIMSKEIEHYSQQIIQAKIKMKELKRELKNTNPDTDSFSHWDTLKAKIQQTRSTIQQYTQLSRNNGGKGNFFSSLFSGSKKVISSIGKILGVTVKIKNQIKQWGSGMKSGLGHVLKYAGALFSLRSIYSTLSSCASSWLSSQNAGAKQLSANIEYMKYAMGNALAPVIEFITSLVYQLMKAIQSVAYALTGVNIFAKASASSYSSMADSASKAAKESKSLAGIDEINNIGGNDSDSSSSGNTAPSFDLSQMDESLLNDLENMDFEELGKKLAKKINDGLEKIDWTEIKGTAKNVASDIAGFINGYVEEFDWSLLGDTIGEGINTATTFANTLLKYIKWGTIGSSIASFLNSAVSKIKWKDIGDTIGGGIEAGVDMACDFVDKFDTKELGKSIATLVNSAAKKIDSDKVGKTISGGINSAVDFVNELLKTTEWTELGESVGEAIGRTLSGIEWNDIGEMVIKGIGSVKDALMGIGLGIVQGIIKGIINATEDDETKKSLKTAIFQFIINDVKKMLGIHSPSTVARDEIGIYVGEGILQGIIDGLKDTDFKDKVSTAWNNVKGWFEDIKATASININQKWSDIKQKWSDLTKNIKNKTALMKAKVGSKWSDIKKSWSNLTSNVKDKTASMKAKVGSKWSDLRSKWENLLGNFKDKTIKVKVKISAIIDNVKEWLNDKFIDPINSKVPDWFPHIPRLAKGNVATEQTLAIFGEYSGAKSNPEITAPQSIIYDTMKQALDDSAFTSDRGNSSMPKEIVIKFGSYRVAYEVQELIRKAQRQSGTATVTI